MLKCEQINISFGSAPILRDVSFALPKGEHLVITGASGSGKTTLLSILTGLLSPQSGRVFYDEQDIVSLSPAVQDRWRARYLGVILQSFYLIPAFTAWQNVIYPIRLRGETLDETRLQGVIKRLGLMNVMHQSVRSLSVGEQQRLSVARALSTSPQWIICDEPTSALDDAHCNALMALLQEEAAQLNASLIVVTHDNRVRTFLQNAQHYQLADGRLA
jgi:putative ABC transport system ATP-binding protein